MDTSTAETIFIVLVMLIIPLITFLFLQYFWIRQLIYCFRHQQDKRRKWLLIILLLNFIGAWYYLRLTPQRPADPDTFEQRLDGWLKEKGFSLEESSSLLLATGVAFAPLGLIGLMMHGLAKLQSYFDFQIPDGLTRAMVIGVIGFLLFLLFKLINFWRNERQLAFFLARPILQAKAGNRGQPSVLSEDPDDAQRERPLVNLIMADLLLFFGLLWSLGFLLALSGISIEEGNSQLWMIVGTATLALLFLFCAFRLNSVSIFYQRPELVFHLLRHYDLYRAITYFIPLLMIIGFFGTFILGVMQQL